MRKETALFVMAIVALFSVAIVANISYGMSKVDFTGLATYSNVAPLEIDGEICTDSDNGRTYVKGETTVFGSSAVDYCIDDVRLQEYGCDTLFRTTEVHVCPYGCFDGACQ